MDRLIVKNFGPLKNVDIELRKINLFIGENGSGKSVLAKLITILTDFQVNNQDIFIKKLNDFEIDYIEKSTYIQLISDKEIDIEFDKGIFNIYTKKNITTSQYIPAERNLISLFNKYVTTFITADIPLPKFLLNFSSQYTRAREMITQLEFLDVQYRFKNAQEYIFYADNQSLPLEQSSSGIQSALPLYLTLKYFTKKHQNIIIEELEQNLFPKAQKHTVEYSIKELESDNRLFIMTHSPYVLSSLNILMMAYKAGNLNPKSKEKVRKICEEKQWINPNDFIGYYIDKGTTKDIRGKTGLISTNKIDDISNYIQDEFEELLAIYRDYKNVR
jgi:predicted ATPase